MAKLVAYMERPDGRVQIYLEQLFASIGIPFLHHFPFLLHHLLGSYFHPSNSGEWSEGLGMFLEYLCKYYAKRGSSGKYAPP
jgi:Proteasome-substrate-size regulator, mid region